MASGAGSSSSFQFKLVLLGSAGVGKSCLVLRFTRNEFFSEQESTIGAAFLTKTILLEDQGPVRVEIWDTAGQERYRSLAPMYYRGAQAAVVVFDVTSAESFEGAKSWVKELGRRADPGLVVALAGNKADLAGKRKVESEEAAEYAKSAGLFYMETSAKDATNVEKLFVECARRVPKVSANPRREGVVPLGAGNAKPGAAVAGGAQLGGGLASAGKGGGCCG